MVSSIRYLSFKEFDIRNQKPFNVLVSIILKCIVIAYKPKVLLFLIMLTYVLSGPLVAIYYLLRNRFKAKGLAHDPATVDDGNDMDLLRDRGFSDNPT